MTCEVRAVWATGNASYALTTTGVNVAQLAAVPPSTTLNWLGIECTGASGDYADFDWMTVQNGPYTWAPMVDLYVGFSDMGVPTGGRQSVLRISEQYDYSPLAVSRGGLILSGSDVGGLAWTEANDPTIDPDTPWSTANGAWDEWDDPSEIAVMEVFAEWRGDEGGGTARYRDAWEFDVYALTGEDGWGHGGLWYTDDIEGATWAPQSWTEISSSVSAFKHRDDCDIDGKEISSGRLIIDHPVNDAYLVIASAGTSLSTGTRGLYKWQKGSGTAPVEYWADPADTGYAALPSALASGTAGNDSFVLVGYRVRTGASASSTALYLCPANDDPATPTAPPACVP